MFHGWWITGQTGFSNSSLHFWTVTLGNKAFFLLFCFKQAFLGWCRMMLHCCVHRSPDTLCLLSHTLLCNLWGEVGSGIWGWDRISEFVSNAFVTCFSKSESAWFYSGGLTHFKGAVQHLVTFSCQIWTSCMYLVTNQIYWTDLIST